MSTPDLPPPLAALENSDFENLTGVLEALKATFSLDVDEETAARLAVNAVAKLVSEPTLWQLASVLQRHAEAHIKQMAPKAEGLALKACVYIHGRLSPSMVEDELSGYELSGYQMSRAQVDAVGSYACLAASLEAFFKMNPKERNMVKLEWMWW